MRRRRLLAASAAGLSALAGCQSSRGDGEATGTPQRTTLERACRSERDSDPQIADADRSLSTAIESGPRRVVFPYNYLFWEDDRGVVASGELAATTGERFTRFECEVENRLDSELRLPIRGSGTESKPTMVPVAEDYETPDDERDPLLLCPTENHTGVESVPTVERGPEGYPRVDPSSMTDRWLSDHLRLDPDETATVAFRFANPPASRGFSRGNYAFDSADRGPELRCTVVHSVEPGPSVDSTVEAGSVPPIDVGDVPPEFCGNAVRWYHETGPEGASWVEPETQTITAAGTYEFVAHNRSALNLGCGHWTLFALRGDGWELLGPTEVEMDCRTLEPGRTRTLELEVGADERSIQDGRDFRVGDLSPGRYAVVSGYGDETGYTGAVFDVAAPL